MSRTRLQALVVGLIALGGCEFERDHVPGAGVHPVGWTDDGSAAFHGRYLREQGYPLDECRTCHGPKLRGGDVAVSCSGSGCHERGVEDCAGTCHGGESGPRPTAGAHAVHGAWCETCHPVPSTLEPPHIDGVVDLRFAGLAAAGGREPSWDPASRTCQNTYCHIGDSPAWESSDPLSCRGCHSLSPTHDRFASIVSEETCGDCHGGSSESGHLDAVLTVSVSTCDRCHGTAASKGAPGPALDGSTDTSLLQVGAHRRHLDSLLSNRIGKVTTCTRCHDVPPVVTAPGHLDGTAPADVDVIQGAYDPMSGTCVVSCHFDRNPGPAWNDDSGAARACDACHAFPPVVTRIGTLHPQVQADLDACAECHAYSSTTHVDGEVTFR